MTTDLELLGDLAFSAEDFNLNPYNGTLALTPEEKIKAASIANRILCEKLAKAPEVRGYEHKYGTTWHDHWGKDDYPHSARLVAIREILSKSDSIKEK